MKKGLLLGLLAMIVSVVSISCSEMKKEISAVALRPECVTSNSYPIPTPSQFPSSWWYASESEAAQALHNFSLMYGLTHNITSSSVIHTGLPGQYFWGFQVCGEPIYYE